MLCSKSEKVKRYIQKGLAVECGVRSPEGPLRVKASGNSESTSREELETPRAYRWCVGEERQAHRVGDGALQ